MTDHLTSSPAATGTQHRNDEGDCEPADRVTKSLLGYGVIAGPIYVVVALAQAVTREGFDLARHQWSLLANGSNGWIQVTNFVVTGLMVIAFAVGLRRALEPGLGTRWAPRLIAVYGASLIAAGIFRADPALGFRWARRNNRPRSPGTACCTSRPAGSASPAWPSPASSSGRGTPSRAGGAGPHSPG